MRKSLAIIASALILAVAGTVSYERLRYDSTVFADTRVSGAGAQPTRVEYPPCVKGVREDRCIQLYERGMRRSYQRWLAQNGRGSQVAQATPSRRALRPCRSRGDDRCQQRARSASRVNARAGVRTARAAPARRVQQAQRRPVAVRTTRPPVTRTAARTPIRATPVRATPAVRQRPVTNPGRTRPGGTPGI